MSRIRARSVSDGLIDPSLTLWLCPNRLLIKI